MLKDRLILLGKIIAAILIILFFIINLNLGIKSVDTNNTETKKWTDEELLLIIDKVE